MRKEKQGISLIVLVITIIVMIILAASVVITLSNSGIIGKANEAVIQMDLKNIQQEAETVKLLEFGNNITMNGHQARMNKNILIQKLLEQKQLNKNICQN
jgi:Tfp pilus assembly protein PilE